MEELARHPGRLPGHAVYQPHDRQAGERLRDLLDVPGMIGVKLHPDVHEAELDSPAYAPAFEIAAERRVAVLSHSRYGSPGPTRRASRRSCRVTPTADPDGARGPVARGSQAPRSVR
ncbi:amidohydrolase family protein [Streptomyces sp. NPDC060035]|uniref:amidohydrolase family protein n=1 Tax=Streptomyces sp. NPDC060035 TaxID=3347044 RepID=UPI00369011C2